MHYRFHIQTGSFTKVNIKSGMHYRFYTDATVVESDGNVAFTSGFSSGFN